MSVYVYKSLTQEQIGVLLKTYYLRKYTRVAEAMNITPGKVKVIEENALRSIRVAFSKSHMRGEKFDGQTVLHDMAEKAGLSFEKLSGAFDSYITEGMASADHDYWERIKCQGEKPTAVELLDFIYMKFELKILPFTLS